MQPPESAVPSTRKNARAERGRLRRNVRRTPYRVPCRVRVVDASGDVRTIVGETINISREGVCFQISIDVAPGTWVETLVPHPNGDPLFLCGRVTRTRRTLAAGFEVGVTIEAPGEFA